MKTLQDDSITQNTTIFKKQERESLQEYSGNQDCGILCIENQNLYRVYMYTRK